MMIHSVQCERCETRLELSETEGYPKDWRKFFFERTTSKQMDLCPSCAAELDRWMQGQEQLA